MTQENQAVAQELEQTLRKALGQLIKKHRKALDYSQRVLSVSLGYSYNVVQHWENGTHKVPVKQLERLKLVLHIPALECKVYERAKGVLTTENQPYGSRILEGLDQRMRQIRSFYDYSIVELSLILDMSRSQYNRVEQGQSNLTLQQLMLLHKMLDIPYSQLLGDEALVLPPVSRPNFRPTKVTRHLTEHE